MLLWASSTTEELRIDHMAISRVDGFMRPTKYLVQFWQIVKILVIVRAITAKAGPLVIEDGAGVRGCCS
jgi:hypothetical protein